MKKIILFLCLLTGVEIKSQIVGGYLPINSSKSATVGTLRVNGALTATGVVTGGSIVSAGSGSFGTTVKAGTVIIGSQTLTPGNSGTASVLGDIVFNIYVHNVAFNPADGTTFTINNIPIIGGSSSTLKVLVPENCELYKWQFNVYTGGTGSAENGTLSLIQNTTVTTLTTGLQYSVVSTTYSNTASVNFTAGDLVALYFTGPTWATNPTVVIHSGILWFRRKL